MIPEAEIRIKGIEALIGALGEVEAERFISLILRDPSDYTKWRHQLFEGLTLDELNEQATRLYQGQKKEDLIS